MNRKQTPSNIYRYEKQLWSEGFRRIMGLDEVGRGCLAGPVVAAGVILDPDRPIDGIRDSKKMTGTDRIEIASHIRESALYWVIRSGSVEEINQLNILRASLLAMRRCAHAEGASPDFLLIDGNQQIGSLIPGSCLVGGDNLSASIGAASIVAKVYRDDLMAGLHETYPHYGWNSNVGYPTKTHKEGLERFGYCEHHRTGFRLGTARVFEPACDPSGLA